MDEQDKILTPEELKEVVEEELKKRLGSRPNRAERRVCRKKHKQEINVVYDAARQLIYKELYEKMKEKEKEYIDNEAD